MDNTTTTITANLTANLTTNLTTITANLTTNDTNMTHMTADIFARYPSITDLLETFAPTSVLAERLVPPLWYVIGLLCNPLCAVIWYGRRMRRNNSSAVYLGTLAVSDMVFLCLHLLHGLHAAWGHDVYNVEGGCEAFMFFFYIPQYMSVLLVAAFTTERYVAVCHPFLKEKWCTVRRACVVSALCLLVSAALASAQVYIWTFYPALGICNTRAEAAEGGHGSFWNVWSWAVEVTVFAALPLAVLVFNVLVLREIVRLSHHGVVNRHHHHHHNQGRGEGGGSGGGGGNTTASTLTLLSVSFFFVVTQLTATVVTNMQLAFPMGQRALSDEQVRADPAWSQFFTYLDVRKVLETVCLSHFACYFLVYCLTGKHFRREVAFLLTCRGKLSCLDRSFSKSRARERYSMVSSNGQSFATSTYSTTFTTAM